MPRIRVGNAVNPASIAHSQLGGLDGDDHLQYHTDARADLRYAPIYQRPLRTRTVTVSSAELLALNATPQILVPAAGDGKALILVGAELWLDYNSVAYSGIAAGEDLTIRYTDGSGAVLATIETTGFLDATTDAWRYVTPAGVIAPANNAPLVLHLSSGEIATGNSPLNLRLLYREITLGYWELG
jgi:hypothetical protein